MTETDHTRSAIVVRPARRADVRAIAEMANEFQIFLAGLENDVADFDVERAVRQMERFGFGATPTFSSLIAEADGAPIGYAIYSIAFWADTMDGMALLTDLFIRKAWRGRGVGRRLMRDVSEAARLQGCERLMWTVWSENAAAQRFYKTLGADAIHEEILMSLPIRAAPG